MISRDPAFDCAESGSSCYLEDMDIFIPCCDSLESCHPEMVEDQMTAVCKQEDCATSGSSCLVDDHLIGCCSPDEFCLPDPNWETGENEWYCGTSL